MQLGLWRALLLPAAGLDSPLCGAPADGAPADGTPADGTPVRCALQPLIGGPRFLRLHAVVEIGGTAFDLVPLRPTAPATAVALIAAQSVEARVRCRRAPSDSSSWRTLGCTRRTPEAVAEFAAAQPTALALGRNDCWTFAAALAGWAIEPG